MDEYKVGGRKLETKERINCGKTGWQTVVVISSDTTFIEWHIRFTTVLFKP